ncbi:MAG TPA: ankyrin repeat domain-containing protein [Nostocaceae cyanobacterium]|nr:ankyrin repeat domain-containing protein [Nostocaceae cyanobacterium]
MSFIAEKTQNLNYNSGMGTALMAAVMSGNSAITEKLITLKADLNQADNNGKTALIYATFFNKTDIVKQLLEAGADKNKKDNDERTALDYATFNKNTELIILLNKQP